MKNISIFGATSHLGVRLVDRLVKTGYSINAAYRVEDRIPETWRGSSAINCFRIDLSGSVDLAPMYTEHVIWLAHIDQGRSDGSETRKNLEPFRRFLNGAAISPMKQITFVSSGGSVYGEATSLPIHEDHPRDPLSTYGKAKKAMEDALLEFGRSFNTRVAIIRPGNIYGFEEPGRVTKGIVGALLNSIAKKRPFTLLGQGLTIRDFIHVNDVCDAVESALHAKQRETIWNAGTGIGSRISDILDLVLKGSDIEPPEFIHRPNYASDVQSNILSIDRITQESGWRPAVTIEVGINRVVNDWIAESAPGKA